MNFKIKINNQLSDSNYCYEKATKIALDLKMMFNDITVKIVELSNIKKNTEKGEK